jgi:voltage-gated potassium channel Kch
MLVLVNTAIVVLILHTLEIIIWALAYQSLVPASELASFEEAVYFSFVTFTTLGYGDITLTEGFRLLSGIEAMNGIILVGWSTAMIFAVVQHIWRNSGPAK